MPFEVGHYLIDHVHAEMVLPLPFEVRSTSLGAAGADCILCTAPFSLEHTLLCKTDLTMAIL